MFQSQKGKLRGKKSRTWYGWHISTLEIQVLFKFYDKYAPPPPRSTNNKCTINTRRFINRSTDSVLPGSVTTFVSFVTVIELERVDHRWDKTNAHARWQRVPLQTASFGRKAIPSRRWLFLLIPIERWRGRVVRKTKPTRTESWDLN